MYEVNVDVVTECASRQKKIHMVWRVYLYFIGEGKEKRKKKRALTRYLGFMCKREKDRVKLLTENVETG